MAGPGADSPSDGISRRRPPRRRRGPGAP
jgi:hypothetical protein